MARLDGSVHKTWRGGKIDCGLRDVVSRLRVNLFTKFGTLLFRAVGADQHSVTPRFAHRLHYVFIEPLADVVTLAGVRHQEGFDAFENRILIEIVTNNFGHVGVDCLIVGYACPQGVRKGNVPGAIRIEEADSAERRRALEDERIKIIVVDATVDHIDPLKAEGGSHVHDVVVHHQVAAFNKFYAHLAREVGVLEVSGVEDAGGEQDDGGFGTAFGRQRTQC